MADALAAGVAETGTTVHVATLEMDAGPVLAQAAVPVLPGDTEETLHERIKAVERTLYPDTIRDLHRRVGGHGGGWARITDGGCTMRALLSVYDKTGLVDLARGLADLGWELVSSGGTSAALAEAGIDHVEVADLTGAPEMLGGRVKTLHPAIHGGILADRSKPEHLDALERLGIGLIDLVVCNLYPFSSDPSVELIDVGGPTMVRAAAKNHDHVGVVVDPADYDAVLDELRTRRVPLARHPPASGPRGVRPHRRLRRRHRRVARRAGAAAGGRTSSAADVRRRRPAPPPST